MFLTLLRIIPSWCYWLIGLIALCGTCELHGRHAERDRWIIKVAAEQAAQVESILTKEREVRRAVDGITVASLKDKENAKVAINNLRSRVQSGAVRLSIAASSGASGSSGIGDQQTRCAILPEAANDLIAIGADADDVVRDLNECVDKYNALR